MSFESFDMRRENRFFTWALLGPSLGVSVRNEWMLVDVCGLWMQQGENFYRKLSISASARAGGA